jgi:hypothetical protein
MTMHETQARLAIIFYYEKLSGCNLYGFLPDRSIWHTETYKKAVTKAWMNLTANGNDQAADCLKNYSL